jgi:hypothetical protein
MAGYTSDGESLRIGSSKAHSPYPLGSVLGMVRAHAKRDAMGDYIRRPGEQRLPGIHKPGMPAGDSKPPMLHPPTPKKGGKDKRLTA